MLRVEKKGPLARGKGADLGPPGSPFPTFLSPADLVGFHFCLLRTPSGSMPALPQMVSQGSAQLPHHLYCLLALRDLGDKNARPPESPERLLEKHPKDRQLEPELQRLPVATASTCPALPAAPPLGWGVSWAAPTTIWPGELILLCLRAKLAGCRRETC